MSHGQNVTLCMRCAALIGAGADMAPHRYLEEVGYQPRGIIHRCMRCLTFWNAGAAGWTRADMNLGGGTAAPVSPATMD